MTQDEFKRRIFDVIKDKIFFSNFSGEMAEVVKEMPEQMAVGKVLFDGIMLLDGIEGVEDDIQQMHSYTKDGFKVNLEDYYTKNGAFEDDGEDRFLAALGNLMTWEEYRNMDKVWVVVSNFWSDNSGFHRPHILVCADYDSALAKLEACSKAGWSEFTEGLSDSEIKEALSNEEIFKPEDENTQEKYHFWDEKYDYYGYIEQKLVLCNHGF